MAMKWRLAFRSLRQRGQAQVEFALAFPLFFLMVAGVFLAGMALLRGALSGWGVFLAGAAGGAYPAPASAALASVPFPDLRAGLSLELRPGERQAVSRIRVAWGRPWLFGIRLGERWQGTGAFRLWRFYPGPPTGPWE
jgi:hypothetical protein